MCGQSRVPRRPRQPPWGPSRERRAGPGPGEVGAPPAWALGLALPLGGSREETTGRQSQAVGPRGAGAGGQQHCPTRARGDTLPVAVRGAAAPARPAPAPDPSLPAVAPSCTPLRRLRGCGHSWTRRRTRWPCCSGACRAARRAGRGCTGRPWRPAGRWTTRPARRTCCGAPMPSCGPPSDAPSATGPGTAAVPGWLRGALLPQGTPRCGGDPRARQDRSGGGGRVRLAVPGPQPSIRSQCWPRGARPGCRRTCPRPQESPSGRQDRPQGASGAWPGAGEQRGAQGPQEGPTWEGRPGGSAALTGAAEVPGWRWTSGLWA